MSENSKKRVLIFSVAYLPFIGGAEVAVKELTDRLSADFEFDLITVNLDGKQKFKENVGPVKVYRMGIGKLCKYTFPISGLICAWVLNRKRHYDFTLAIMANYAGLVALFFELLSPKIPMILTLQEGDSMEHIKSRMHPFWLFKMIFQKADKVTVISNYLANWAKEMGAQDVTVVPNGVDVSRFKNLDSGFKNKKKEELGFKETDTVLVTTSRLVEKNAVGDIVEAIKLLPEDFKLLVVGSGPLLNSLKLKADSWKLKPRINFVGNVVPEKVPEYLWASDIFIRPSLSEGFGNSFIEAMASGLPVIATPVGGIVDFLKDEETGLFCKVNDPKSVADAVSRLINEPELKDRIIANASKMVHEKYDWNIVSKQTKEIFDKVII